MKPLEETDTFQYEPCYSFVAKRQRIVWGYKDKKGIVHSGLVDSLDEALEKAKRFGYQPNETAESKLQQDLKLQHDLVEKSYTPKSPSEIKRKKKHVFLKGLIAATITFAGLSKLFPETTDACLLYSVSIYESICDTVERERLFRENRKFFKKQQRELEEQMPPKVYECFKKARKIKYKAEDIGKDYWQTPKETEEKGKGDCEDIAIYLYDLLKKEGIESEVVTGLMMEAAYFTMHVWNEYEHNKEKIILDATVGNIFKRKSN